MFGWVQLICKTLNVTKNVGANELFVSPIGRYSRATHVLRISLLPAGSVDIAYCFVMPSILRTRGCEDERPFP